MDSVQIIADLDKHELRNVLATLQGALELASTAPLSHRQPAQPARQQGQPETEASRFPNIKEVLAKVQAPGMYCYVVQ